MKPIVLFITCLLSCLLLRAQHTGHPAVLQTPEKRNVLFLGNSITYAGMYVAMLESLHVYQGAESRAEYLNLGLPSETVSGLTEPGHADGKFPRPDLFERLDRVLQQVKPSLVFVCYGMNDGIYKPFEEQRFAAYQEGIKKLAAKLKEAGVERVVWLTPPVHDDLKTRLKGYNLVLDRYATWLKAYAAQEEWTLVDLHFPMKAYLERQIQQDSDFRLATDGIHPGLEGHWLMAKEIYLQIHPDFVAYDTWREMLEKYPKLDALYALVYKKQSFLKDAWLSKTGHKRPGMAKGLPLAEAQAAAQQVQEEILALQQALRKK
ncbi:SGNH/GDSL hydrolase family protein [Sphingobacterium humi]|uniref:G-D-S-L family lipolytic protein n=1 Tax=Sphingobacterium humi TaxID=1796905 RepID=A0A6N8KV26_9SPHI|nr:SGNH/GDSL hydrolase family protein [Sphingobacterium humi]MVZ60569.1 G-D-S-L family lipolytic protein [Sphingobacterium humi]